jgi:hypothetical protein
MESAGFCSGLRKKIAMKTPAESPLRQRFPVCVLKIALCLLVLIPVSAGARAPIRKSFFDVYTNAAGSKLDSLSTKLTHCGVCHYKFDGSGTRNLYGAAVEARYNANGKNGIEAVQYVRAQDSDTDGFSNDTEVTNTITYANTPAFPGLKTANTNLVQDLTSAQMAELAGYLTPAIGGDTTPPIVTLGSFNSGQTIIANRATNITWSASDDSGIASINLYLSLNNGSTWSQIARGLNGVTNFSWVPSDRPATNTCWIKVVAADTYGNASFDTNNTPFTIISDPATNSLVDMTLRDFDMAGTQPFEHGPDLDSPVGCATCHGNYDSAKEPYFNWQGSMMSQAARDPLFLANMALANQDVANSGDLCLRCHFSRGWLAGRSVPTDGSRMEPEDTHGINCALCHRLVDPVYSAGVSPTNDQPIIGALSFPGTNYGNGMFVIDPNGLRRGPYTNSTMGHDSLGSPFHRTAAFCGTCHDVSNPAFTKDANGVYQPNDFNAPSPTFSPHFMAPVERTFSEWVASSYNSSNGVYAPVFAGGRTNGYVSTCQHCHMRTTSGYVANPAGNPGISVRTNDMGLHDMTGGSLWLAGMMTNMYPTVVTNLAAVEAGITRSYFMLTNAATLAVGDSNGLVKVTITNECGHKLPTGYPEGRRVWLNVKFYNDANTLLGESGAYNETNGVLTRTNGVLTHDGQAKIYEVHPGIDTNISGLLGLAPEPSLHFVLNNKIYEDNRIPPRGFTNATFAAFGGAPVGHHYNDGQYWDDTLYTPPAGTTRAEVKLYYQSTSKEFIEFLRDENRTTSDGQIMYDLWNNNGKCPPTLMAQTTWVTAFAMKSTAVTPTNTFRIEFYSRPGVNYTVEYKNDLLAPSWSLFNAHGSLTATNTVSHFEDDFTANTSGSVSPTGARFYRIKYTAP